jgi:hypothetical protein
VHIQKYAHHRLVKTTPKPNATKNRRGEEFELCCGLLFPPELPVCPLAAVSDADGDDAEADDTDDGIMLDESPLDVGDALGVEVEAKELMMDPVVAAAPDTVSRAIRRTPSTNTWLMNAMLSAAMYLAGKKEDSTMAGVAQPFV